jgi:enhancing lycopene biosynthesis protein 2
LIFPGGFGAAKNLCNFAFKGKDFDVDPLVRNAMLNFNLNKKLIGACCISPIMIAKVFSGQKVEITLGKKIQNVILNLN